MLKPIKRAQEGGFGGSFKGVGDGAIGVVTKTAAGVMNAGQQVANIFQCSEPTFERLRVP
jgi:hypothetical protein